MNTEQLLETLQQLARTQSSIPGIKTLQPWATWIVHQTKEIDIRTKPNHYRGLVGIIASGWDTRFSLNDLIQYDRPCYEKYCLLGFCKLTAVKRYDTLVEFMKDFPLHRNPAAYFMVGLYGWILTERTPIKPLYYKHYQNRKKEDLLCFEGTMARVRIPIDQLEKKVVVI
jgi:hypothetical protein